METSIHDERPRVQMINLSCWLVRGELCVKVIKRSLF